ncbi:hypothetical protein VB784_000918 [Campylobacter upsaliensis]|nr:hypothetical protein [Campylobacter upsaliensis]EHP6621275.1 hypothetical protein [Campylobacter upsaliensis]EIJ6627423.1 hypothetical protein [Campylobacter upsaliensis]EKY2262344.1 hypothetical protein [Campylobacter upsaliensis]ELD5175524.1 hypothetical protein [Campylobacter upsaliensis]
MGDKIFILLYKWIGFIYTGESIADFVPQIKFQTAIIQREKTVLQTKNFYFQSQKAT